VLLRGALAALGLLDRRVFVLHVDVGAPVPEQRAREALILRAESPEAAHDWVTALNAARLWYAADDPVRARGVAVGNCAGDKT